MKIMIVGAGGVGGLCAVRWAEAGHSVSLVARGAHLKAIQDHGITLRAADGEVTASVEAASDPRNLEAPEVIMLATKTWQLADALAALRPVIDQAQWVFGTQNGVDSVAEIAQVTDKATVLGAIFRVISFIDGPGRIRHQGVSPSLIFGDPTGQRHGEVSDLAASLHVGDRLAVIASDAIERELWKKFLFFAPSSGVHARYRATVGEVRDNPKAWAELRAALNEVAALAKARGIDFPDDIVARTIDFIGTMPAEGTYSLQRDFRDGQRTELEALAAAVSRMGRESGIPTPIHDAIVHDLMPLELAARGEA